LCQIIRCNETKVKRLNVLRRLHALMVFALVASFISMSVAQVVAASTIDQIPMPSSDHALMDHSSQDHDHRSVDDTSKRDCLDYCLETIDGNYLAGESKPLSVPELSTENPVAAVLANAVTRRHSVHQMHTARGPPVYPHLQTVTGLRGLLLLNARLRN